MTEHVSFNQNSGCIVKEVSDLQRHAEYVMYTVACIINIHDTMLQGEQNFNPWALLTTCMISTDRYIMLYIDL